MPVDLPPDTYRIAVEEYRFQAQFNWTRTQYLLAFNAAVLAAAAGLARPAGPFALMIFALGAVAAAMSIVAVAVQHGYYRRARDRMRRIENLLPLPPELRLDTTANLGGRKRAVSVNQIVYLLLGAIVVANIIGAALVVLR